jgi:hypothetical protein
MRRIPAIRRVFCEKAEEASGKIGRYASRRNPRLMIDDIRAWTGSFAADGFAIST